MKEVQFCNLDTSNFFHYRNNIYINRNNIYIYIYICERGKHEARLSFRIRSGIILLNICIREEFDFSLYGTG